MNTPKTHIVFAEDDVSLAHLIKDFLERNHFVVSLVHDGAQVVQVVEQEQPDVLLLDIMLPNIDGLTLCQTLRPTFANPIMLFTANDSEIKHILGLDLGANDYIVKTTRHRFCSRASAHNCAISARAHQVNWSTTTKSTLVNC